MKKISFLVLLIAQLIFNTAVAQSPRFDIVCPESGVGGKLESWQNSEGTTYIWDDPQFAFTSNSFRRPLGLEKIEQTDGKITDTIVKLLTPVVQGYKDAIPYKIVLTGNKLYALVIVKINELTDDIYADEIELHDISLHHKPFKIFEYTHTELKGDIIYEHMSIEMTQSADRSKTLLFINECKKLYKAPNVFHFIAFDNGFNNILWERRDTLSQFYFTKVALGNNGTAVFTGSYPAAIFSKKIREGDKDVKSIIFFTMFNERGIVKKKIMIDDYTINDLKTVMTPDGKIIAAGFYHTGANMFAVDGIFYISFNSPEEDYSIKKGKELKVNLSKDISTDRFYLRNLLLADNGIVWLVGEHQFGINSHDNYGNLLVAAVNEEGDLQSVRVIDKQVDLKFNGTVYTTFSAQVYKDRLVCVYNDDNTGLNITTVSADGQLNTNILANFKKDEPQPLNFALYTSAIQNGVSYIFCEVPKSYASYIGKISL